jgi:hypothetical protein
VHTRADWRVGVQSRLDRVCLSLQTEIATNPGEPAHAPHAVDTYACVLAVASNETLLLILAELKQIRDIVLLSE